MTSSTESLAAVAARLGWIDDRAFLERHGCGPFDHCYVSPDKDRAVTFFARSREYIGEHGDLTIDFADAEQATRWMVDPNALGSDEWE